MEGQTLSSIYRGVLTEQLLCVLATVSFYGRCGMYDFLLVVFWGCGQTPPVLCARNCLRMPKIFPCSPLCTFFQRLGCFLHSFCVENRNFFKSTKPVCCFFRESASPWQGLSGIELRAWLIVAARPAWDSLRSLTHLFFVLVLLGAAYETK